MSSRWCKITHHSETYDNRTGLTDYGTMPNNWK